MALVPSTSVGGSSSGGAIAQVYDSIAGGAVASFDVTGIAGTYTHLQVVGQLRCDQAGAQAFFVRLNGDSAANYSGQTIQGGTTASGIETIAGTAVRVGTCPGTAATAGLVGVCNFLVINYAATTFKKALVGTAGRVDAFTTGNVQSEVDSGTWNNTAAVTQLTIVMAAGNFIAGSRLTVYGIT